MKTRISVFSLLLIILSLFYIIPTLASIRPLAVATGYRLPYIEGNLRTVTQGFDAQVAYGSGYHGAYDFGMRNNPIAAAKSGVVVAAKYEEGPGGCNWDIYKDRANYVIIYHPDDGLYSFYGHIRQEQQPVVKVGQLVSAGDLIAYAGNSGYHAPRNDGTCGEGYHLHFTVQETAKPFD